MDNLHSLQQILDGKRDGDVDSFLVFLRDEGLELLAAYRSIRDDDVRASLCRLILNVAGSSTPSPGDDGPAAA